MPKVSVLLCTYNAEEHIIATLKSILSQTYTDFEVLILDNNSKDKTVELITSFADKRIQIFKGQKNLGPYRGLNYLLERATGEYIAIQDHDDLWYPQKIAKQIDFLDKHKHYVGCGTKTLMRYEGDQMGFEYFLGKTSYYTIHPSLVFRNIPGLRYPDTVYMADALFQKTILCKGERLIHNLDETFTMHRIKNGTSNYSYKRYKLTWKNLKTVFSLHPLWYAVFATLFELMRKIIYPILTAVRCGYVVDRIERLPFRLQGYRMRKFDQVGMEKMGFNIYG